MDKIKKIFSVNQKMYIITSLVFYLLTFLHYSIVYDLSECGFSLSIVSPFFDPIIFICMIIACFLSINLISIYCFPYNVLLGKARYYGILAKLISAIFPSIVLIVKETSFIYFMVVNSLLIVLILIDCIKITTEFVKIQNKHISEEILSTQITEEEYTVLNSYWNEILKMIIFSSMLCGIITSKNINLDIRLVNPILFIVIGYNWIKVYNKYKNIVVDNKRSNLISLSVLILMLVFSIYDLYITGKCTFNGLEYFAMYSIAILIQIFSLNRINFEVVKYKYYNEKGNGWFRLYK